MIYIIAFIVVAGVVYLLRHAITGAAWNHLDDSINRTTKY